MSTQYAPTMTIDELRREHDTLTEDYAKLACEIDNTHFEDEDLAARSRAEMSDRMLSLIHDRLLVVGAEIETRQSNAAREAAEARWQYHADHDTLDLY